MCVSGEVCESVLVPCALRPCKNGGVCRESEDFQSFSCTCPAGWQGKSVCGFMCISCSLHVLICSLTAVVSLQVRRVRWILTSVWGILALTEECVRTSVEDLSAAATPDSSEICARTTLTTARQVRHAEHTQT